MRGGGSEHEPETGRDSEGVVEKMTEGQKRDAVTVIMEMASILGVFVMCFMFLYNLVEKHEEIVEKQGERIDKIYQMIYEIIKDKKEKSRD